MLLASGVAGVCPLRSTPPRFIQKAARRDHRNAPKWVQHKQVFVTTHNTRSFSTHRQFKEFVVLGITTFADMHRDFY